LQFTKSTNDFPLFLQIFEFSGIINTKITATETKIKGKNFVIIETINQEGRGSRPEAQDVPNKRYVTWLTLR